MLSSLRYQVADQSRRTCRIQRLILNMTTENEITLMTECLLQILLLGLGSVMINMKQWWINYNDFDQRWSWNYRKGGKVHLFTYINPEIVIRSLSFIPVSLFIYLFKWSQPILFKMETGGNFIKSCQAHWKKYNQWGFFHLKSKRHDSSINPHTQRYLSSWHAQTLWSVEPWTTAGKATSGAAVISATLHGFYLQVFSCYSGLMVS